MLDIGVGVRYRYMMLEREVLMLDIGVGVRYRYMMLERGVDVRYRYRR